MGSLLQPLMMGCDQASPTGSPGAFVLLHLEGGDTQSPSALLPPLEWPTPWLGVTGIPAPIGLKELCWKGHPAPLVPQSPGGSWKRGPGLMLLLREQAGGVCGLSQDPSHTHLAWTRHST